MNVEGNPLTFAYKHVGGKPSSIDVFLPSSTSRRSIPALVYFHGGGLTFGNRKLHVPGWMLKRATCAGYAFISADYQLLSPSTAHDIVEDIVDLFRFLAGDLNGLLAVSKRTDFQIDSSSLIAAGSSAGGACAYWAALHATPKPKAVLSLYGMGGDLLSPQYLTIKNADYFPGFGMLNPVDFGSLLHPFPPDASPTADSPPVPPKSPTPNPRQKFMVLLLQQGTYLDYYMGEHEPSLSPRLREIVGLELEVGNGADASKDSVEAAAREIIPHKHVGLFPQLAVSEAFPPTFLVHGDADTSVKIGESYNMKRLLDKCGVETVLRIAEGKGHVFDYAPDVEEKFGDLFDEVFVFIDKILGRK